LLASYTVTRKAQRYGNSFVVSTTFCTMEGTRVVETPSKLLFLCRLIYWINIHAYQEEY